MASAEVSLRGAASDHPPKKKSTVARRLTAVLSQARQLGQQQRYRDAIRLLKRFAKRNRLSKDQMAKVARRLARLQERDQRDQSKAGESLQKARKLLTEHSYARAAEVLTNVPARLRTGEANDVLRRARSAMCEVESLTKQIAGLNEPADRQKLAQVAWRLVALKPHEKQYRALAERFMSLYRRRAQIRLAKLDGPGALAELEQIPRELWTKAVTELAKQATSQSLVTIAREQRERALGRSAPEPPAAIHRRILESRWMPWLLAAYVVVVLMLVVYKASRFPTRISTAILEFTALEEPNDDAITLTITPPTPEPTLEEAVPVEPDPEPLPEAEPEKLAIPEPIVELVDFELPEPPTPTSESIEPVVPQPEPPEETVLTNLVSTPTDTMPEAAADPKPKPDRPPARAVSSGSFAVWVDPPFPRSGEPYSIYIRIRLPDRITRYTWGDLSGYVMGSDGYRKPIQGPKRKPIPLVDHTATIVIPVVGAERMEMDTIAIRSRILRQQRLIELHHAL